MLHEIVHCTKFQTNKQPKLFGLFNNAVDIIGYLLAEAKTK